MESPPGHRFDHIVHMYAHEIFSQYDMYFLNGSHFSFFSFPIISYPAIMVDHVAKHTVITRSW